MLGMSRMRSLQKCAAARSFCHDLVNAKHPLSFRQIFKANCVATLPRRHPLGAT